jgi:hypothetical protein
MGERQATVKGLVTMLAMAQLFCASTPGFSLLGPFESWQHQGLGYNVSGEDIGGVKNLDEEYRWNVPVLTYAVDRAFVDFFGQPGVEAVQEAFGILNALPPASLADLSQYALDTRRVNFRAQATNLVDLKSMVLSLALEQLGLAPPERNVWVLRDRKVNVTTLEPFTLVTNYLVIGRNFDPVSYQVSAFVNEARYTYEVVEFAIPQFADAVERVADPTSGQAFSSVPNFAFERPVGVFLTGLTRDDVGGLRYLLHPSNLNFEQLPDDVTLAAENPASPFVRGALRGGVDKLEFVFVPEWSTTQDWSKTLEWSDKFYDAGVARQQRVKRTQRVPDIVISAADLGTLRDTINPALFTRNIQFRPTIDPFGSKPGPGTFQGPVIITFAKLDRAIINRFPAGTTEEAGLPLTLRWGSFDETATPPIVFPLVPLTPTAPQLQIAYGNNPGTTLIEIAGDDAPYEIQVSTNLTQWIASGIILSETNNFSAVLPVAGSNQWFRGVRLP